MSDVIPGLGPGWVIPSMGRRIASRGLDALVGFVALLPAYLMVANLTLGLAEFVIYVLLYSACAFGVQLMAGGTIGQLILSHRNVDLSTGQPSGPRTVGKYIVMGISGQISFGLLPLLAVITVHAPLNQTWFDKWLGVVVLRRTVGAPQPRGRLAHANSDDVATSSAAGIAEPPSIYVPPIQTTAPVEYQPPWAQSPATAVGLPPVMPPTRPSMSARPAVSPGLGTDQTEVRPMRDLPLIAANLVLDNGLVLVLDNPYVLGRDPVATDGHEGATPVAVLDPDRSISKTHVLIGPTLGGAFVIDLHSTNGVAITPPGEDKYRLTPGEQASAPYGSTISFW